MNNLNIVMVQQGFDIGAIEANCDKIMHLAQQAADMGADIALFPELCLTGYPPEDLLLRASLQTRVQKAIERLLEAPLDCAIIFGAPIKQQDQLYNAAIMIDKQKVVFEYHKQELPNYQVFDEKRYFTSGQQASIVQFKGIKLAIAICEDVWFDPTIEHFKQLGAEVVLTLNASPFHMHRQQQRLERIQEVSARYQLPILYVNGHYAQDELVFDGGSFVCNAQGDIAIQAPEFDDKLECVNLDLQQTDFGLKALSNVVTLEPLAALYKALVLGLRSYVNKNAFKGVVLGLSGGIDSGLSVAIACDALGKERVHAVMMPFEYTSKMSIDDAQKQAELLDVKFDILPIADMFQASMHTLAPLFTGTKVDTTEQNLQARIRGMLLMALSNKTGNMVLTTGNKSEMAVGYATLYGDMCGGFNVLKDVPKTLVFALSHYRNSLSAAIPERVITRPPSAELAPDQKDEDSLPPYEILDAIIEAYVERDLSYQAIVALGYEAEMVAKVCRLIDINEYKRRQSAEGVRITQRGFGRDRRYPICNQWPLGV